MDTGIVCLFLTVALVSIYGEEESIFWPRPMPPPPPPCPGPKRNDE